MTWELCKLVDRKVVVHASKIEQYLYGKSSKVVEITEREELLEALVAADLVNRPLSKSMYPDLAKKYEALINKIDPMWSKPRAWMQIIGNQKHMLVRGYISKNKLIKTIRPFEQKLLKMTNKNTWNRA